MKWIVLSWVESEMESGEVAIASLGRRRAEALISDWFLWSPSCVTLIKSLRRIPLRAYFIGHQIQQNQDH